MIRFRREPKAVEQPDCSECVEGLPDLPSGGPAALWTRANIGEVLPGVVTPLTWSVFRANLLRRPVGRVEAESSPHDPLRLVEGRAYLRLDALLGSFCYLPGVDPEVVCQALGVDRQVLRRDGGRKPKGNLLTWLSGGLFLAEVLGLSPVLWLQLRLGLGRAQHLPLVGASMSQGITHIEKLIDRNTRCFQLHLKCTRYAIGAYGLLRYMLRRWLPANGLNPACAEGGPPGQGMPSCPRTSVPAEAALLLGQAELQTAEQGLALWRLAEQARALPDVAAALENEVDWTTTRRALQATEGGQRFLAALAAFLARHGARTAEEFELASPRWREDPTFVLTVLRNYLHADAVPDLSRPGDLSEAAVERALRQMGPLKRWLFRRVLRAYRAYVPLRENMKYRLMEGYAALRHCFLTLGECLCASGALADKEDVFFLTAAEALAAVRGDALNVGEIRAKVNRRRAERMRQERFQPPEVIEGNNPAWASADSGLETLQGIGCSPGWAIGKARVIRDVAMASRLRPGEILVAPSTDPGWTPLFLTAAAVVTDIGGFLSHGATVAREYGIPAVVNTKKASELVRDGQWILVDGSRGIVYLSPNSHLPASARSGEFSRFSPF